MNKYIGKSSIYTKDFVFAICIIVGSIVAIVHDNPLLAIGVVSVLIAISLIIFEIIK